VKELTMYDIIENGHVRPKHIVVITIMHEILWCGNNHCVIETFTEVVIIILKINY
jgi:hypothetical protein